MSLPQPYHYQSTPSIAGQTPTTTFPLNFATVLNDRNRELLATNIPLRLDWNTFVAPLPYLDNILIVTDYIPYSIETTSTKTYKKIIHKFLIKIT